MFRVKLFAMALVITLAGVVYAAGRAQDAGHQHNAADKAACCKAHQQKDGQPAAAMACDKDGCCKGHKAEGQSCCAGGNGSCCKEGAECCKGHQKAGAAVVKTGAAAGEPAGCCKEGAECCKEGAECCKAHKAAGQKAGEKHEGCCCGDSCQKHEGR